MPGEASGDLGWGDALRLFATDLRRHGSVDKALRAYTVELRALADWAIGEGLGPEAIDRDALRRYPAPVDARKVAALRAFFRVLRVHGLIVHSPVDRLPAVGRGRGPAVTALEVRDRAIFALAETEGLRAEELVALDLPAADAAAPTAELAEYLRRGRPALAAGDDEPALFLSKSGRRLSASDVRRRLAAQLLDAPADVRAVASSSRSLTRVDSARLKTAYARSHPRA